MNANTTTPSQTITHDGPDTPVSAPAPAKQVFTAQGDRHPAVNLVYPAAAFMHAGKGGRLVDVTQPPFNAKGDGKTDDTQALIAARDFVMQHHEPAYCGRHLLKGNYILYLPNGTYLVSDSVNHNLPVMVGDGVWDNYQQHPQPDGPVGRRSGRRGVDARRDGGGRAGGTSPRQKKCRSFPCSSIIAHRIRSAWLDRATVAELVGRM